MLRMGIHHSRASRLPLQHRGGWQTEPAFCSSGSPPKHKAQHLRGMSPSASGRVCPRWILLEEAGGAAHCATGRNTPARVSHLLCLFASTCANLQHEKGSF